MDPYSQTASQLATLAPLLTIVSALSLLGLLAGIALDYTGDFAPAPTIGGWERDIHAAVTRRRLTLTPSVLSVRSWRACQRARTIGRADLADRAIGAWASGDYRRALSLAGAACRWAPATAATEAPTTETTIVVEPVPARAPLALVPVLSYRRPALFAPPARVALVDERPPTSWERFAHPIAVGGAA